MYIYRLLIKQIEKYLIPGQVVVVYGARRVGKTTIIKHLLKTLPGKTKFINADNRIERKGIQTDNLYDLRSLLSQYSTLIIDEAQKVANIGEILKLIVDNIPELQILVSGSASFELANQIGEPLTGRKRTLTMYPIAMDELFTGDPTNLHEQLEERLIYGSYPKVMTIADRAEKKVELEEIVSSYLFKDILELQNIKNPQVLQDLLTLLAFQIGSEVSVHEIGQKLGLHREKTEQYLDLLEKVFVIYKVRALSRNLRNEVTKSAKYYFYDNGIRNTIINNFNGLSLRNDVGHLWENFLMNERMKFLSFEQISVKKYFWRTYQQKEIDLVEERDGKFFAYEFKYNTEKVKIPREFLEGYPESTFNVVHKGNFVDFITKKE